MPNSSSTWVSRPTTSSLALDLALCTEPGLSTSLPGSDVGDVARQRQLLDPLRQGSVRRRFQPRVLRVLGRQLGVGGRASRWSSLSRPPTPVDLAVLEHRGVVRREAGRRVDRVVQRTPTAARTHRLGGQLPVLGVAVLDAHQLGAGLAEPGRDQVDRRRGDDQDPEERQQRQQRHHDVRRPQQVEQQARHHVADRAAGVLQVGGVAAHGRRAPVGDVHDAEGAEAEGGPADRLAADRTVVLGVAQVAPARRTPAGPGRTTRPCRPSRPGPCG